MSVKPQSRSFLASVSGILGSDGIVVADSEAEPSKMDNYAERPEIVAARVERVARLVHQTRDGEWVE